MKSHFLIKLILILHVIVAGFATFHYAGNAMYFVAFSLAFLAVLFSALKSYSTPTLCFFGGMIWLGFFLKVCAHFVFKVPMGEATGDFSYSGPDWDHALLLSSVVGLAYSLTTTGIRVYLEKKHRNKSLFVLSTYESAAKSPAPKTLRTRLLFGSFTFLVLGLTIANLFLGINISGMVAMTILPWPGNALVAWTLYYGLALLACELCLWEYKNFGQHRWGFAVVLIEAAAVSLSILSRGLFVFRVVPLLLFNLFNYKKLGMSKNSLFFRVALVAVAGFATISSTNVARSMLFNQSATVFDVYDVDDPDMYLFDPREMKADPPQTSATSVGATGKNILENMSPELPTTQDVTKSITGQALGLMLNRWIGIEGILAVDSWPGKSVSFMRDAFVTKPAIGDVDVYNIIAKSGHSPSMMYNFSSIPGPAAAFFYSGSIWIMFLGISFFCLIMALLDLEIFRYFKNPFLTMILSFQFASAFSQFGLAPPQFVISIGMTIFGLIGLFVLRRILLTARAKTSSGL